MLLVVAPYDGALPENSRFLAGAKKIRTIIKALKLIDPCVVLLNSGHQNSVCHGKVIRQVDFDGEGLIDVITPPTRRNSYIGRLLNLASVPSIIADVVDGFGVPETAWFYNGYAFEMRAASYLKKMYGTQNILEFEDWHFARNRGINPKPYLDWLCWRAALRSLDAGFVVNAKLRDRLESFGVPTKLMPGTVATPISKVALNSPPFRSDKITVGYFGGLSEEKGAAVLLRLARKVGNNVHFIITGSGPLDRDFRELEKTIPERFAFLGAVSESTLVMAISKVDVILNAHHPNEGVFPFKIIEAIASGRLVISTKLPMTGYEWFGDAIQFYDGNENRLLELINDAHNIYLGKKSHINVAVQIAAKQYGQSGLVENISETLAQCPPKKH